MAQQVQCLPHQHEDPSWSSNPMKRTLYNLCIGMWGQGRLLGHAVSKNSVL